jgi:hypothetical protein
MKGVHRKDKAAVADLLNLMPGDYVYVPGQGWHACTPNGHLANLSAHDCDYDKESDTLTVAPSISVKVHGDGDGLGGELHEVYHGYLERGVWRNA